MGEILVVDDSASDTTVYERVVNQIPGHTARCFIDPFEALAWAEAYPPALVVVDYKMRKLDGVEFIKQLRAQHGNEKVPIAMLTAVASPVLWQISLDAGANAHLRKPIDEDQFIETVQNLLGASAKA